LTASSVGLVPADISDENIVSSRMKWKRRIRLIDRLIDEMRRSAWAGPLFGLGTQSYRFVSSILLFDC
jgi:hypothetical protein